MTAASIIICTRDHAESLRDTLSSIAQCYVPADLSTELIIVDNASIDHTAEVIEQTSIDGIPVRYLFEARKGKGYAYNCGLTSARSDILLFTDDDVHVPPNWIADMCKPIVSNKTDAVAGGVVIPPMLRQRLGEWNSWFASTEDIDSARPERMVGANMAFARRVLEAVPQFDVQLGPGALGFGDETLFSFQLIAAGFRIASAFDVQVEHHFDAARLTKRYFRDLARRMGCSAAYMQYHWDQTPSTIGRREALVSWLGLWRRRLTRPIEWLNSFPPPAWELQRLQDLAFYRQYQIERARKPNYVRGSKSRKSPQGN